MLPETIERTKFYIDSELKSGMEQIEFDSLKTMIENLGYTLKFDFNYINTHNPPYLFAVTAYNIIENKSGKSFANIDSDKTNLKQLQEIRGKYLCVKNNRIVQI